MSLQFNFQVYGGNEKNSENIRRYEQELFYILLNGLKILENRKFMLTSFLTRSYYFQKFNPQNRNYK